MTNDQYFRPQVQDFWEGAIFYTAVRNYAASEYGDYAYVASSYAAGRDYRLIAHLMKDESGYGNVYMKYLDGEQITAFGFERINMPPWGYSMAMNAPDIEWFCRGQWFVSFNNKFRNMGIYQYDAKNHGQYLHFSGEVRDINRFKLIVDWIIIAYERQMIEAQQNQLKYGKEKEGGKDRLQISS